MRFRSKYSYIWYNQINKVVLVKQLSKADHETNTLYRTGFIRQK